jgi:hypothetical protein
MRAHAVPCQYVRPNNLAINSDCHLVMLRAIDIYRAEPPDTALLQYHQGMLVTWGYWLFDSPKCAADAAHVAHQNLYDTDNPY